MIVKPLPAYVVGHWTTVWELLQYQLSLSPHFHLPAHDVNTYSKIMHMFSVIISDRNDITNHFADT